MGRVGLRLRLSTPNLVGLVGWIENGSATDQIFRLDLVARVIGWMGQSCQVILYLKNKNSKEIKSKEHKPKQLTTTIES